MRVASPSLRARSDGLAVDIDDFRKGVTSMSFRLELAGRHQERYRNRASASPRKSILTHTNRDDKTAFLPIVFQRSAKLPRHAPSNKLTPEPFKDRRR